MGTLDTVQQEQLRVIGTYLNQVRQEQSRSLEDIAAKTYIPLRLLKAIEQGQEQPLPEPVFVQGFIRRYADSLGLDGMELAQKFPVQVTPLPTVATASAASRARSPESSYLNRSTEDQEMRQSQPSSRSAYWPYVAAAAALAVGGIGLAVVNSISSRPANRSSSELVLPKQPTPPRSSISLPSPAPSPVPSPAPSPASTSVSPTPAVLSSPESAPRPSSPRLSPSAPATPVRVELELTGDSWVQVTVDGVVKTEAVLPKGTQQAWSGRQQITVVSGNAGAVSVAANGAPAKTMGAAGAVTELTVKPR